jgi:hypothetical protein
MLDQVRLNQRLCLAGKFAQITDAVSLSEWRCSSQVVMTVVVVYPLSSTLQQNLFVFIFLLRYSRIIPHVSAASFRVTVEYVRGKLKS